LDDRSEEILRRTWRQARDVEIDLQLISLKKQQAAEAAIEEHKAASEHLAEIEEMAALHDVILDPLVLLQDNLVRVTSSSQS
jgi:hypothetical protein